MYHMFILFKYHIYQLSNACENVEHIFGNDKLVLNYVNDVLWEVEVRSLWAFECASSIKG